VASLAWVLAGAGASTGIALAAGPQAPPTTATAPAEGAAPEPVVPTDSDERGLWMQAEEGERELKNSRFVIRDPALNAYIRSVFCRTVGEAECANVRVYLVRTAYFNASMAPNGVMQIWSGLLLRMHDEAQLAAVLAHEHTHYRNRHTLKLFRDIKKKASAATWLSFVPFGFIASYGIIGSIFSYSRDMERDADYGSLELLTKAGYDPTAASRIWAQVRDEMDATAAARNKKSRKDQDRGLFATHPPTLERMTELEARAKTLPKPVSAPNMRADYIRSLSGWWPTLIDDQIKLNDFGGTEFLLGRLAQDGWTPDLLFARGELHRMRGAAGDLEMAARFYRQATAGEAPPPESWRGLGIVLMRVGRSDEGRAALARYLSEKPDASDRALIETMARN
jgi:predicted Zn-dependent protease